MLTLSRHFCENWEKRIGRQPTVEAVREYIRESVKIQHCRDLVQDDGSNYRMLALYWNTELKVIISVDHIREVAVSVLSEECCRDRNDEKLRS